MVYGSSKRAGMINHNVRPRVLLFNPAFRPVVGGAERQVERLAGTLHEQGAKAEVLTMQLSKSWPLMEVLPSGVTLRRISYRDVARAFPGVTGLGIVNILVYGRSISRTVATLAGNFDVLHAFNASTPMTPFAVRAAKRSGLRTVVRAVNSKEWFDLRILRRQPVWGRLALGWLLRDVDLWQAVSGAVGEDLERIGIPSERIVALPNGVRLGPGTRELPRQATRFLHLGRLGRTAPRDVAGLIAVFAEAATVRQDIELAVVGDGEELSAMRTQAGRSRCPDRIHVPGEGDREKWLRWAHCLVQPSFVEGMSNALLEGLAAGLACVAYDIPANREVLSNGEAGILVPVGDRGKLRMALESLAGEPGFACDLGRRGRAHVAARYNIEAIAREAIMIYRKLHGLQLSASE